MPGKYKQVRCGLELYDLEADRGETHNVAADHPDVVERLQALVEKAREDLGDDLTKREGAGRRPAGRVEQASKPAKPS
jgi:arylsulfatase A